MHYWFFGPPGSGKDYVANLFSIMTGVPHFEGDDFHTENDREVIANGTFTIAHRHAQLTRISDQIGNSNAVITHPLPDRHSRARLIELNSRLVYVKAPVTLIKERLVARKGHHFGVDLFDAWIPKHWQDPVDEQHFVIHNDGSELTEQLRRLNEFW